MTAATSISAAWTARAQKTAGHGFGAGQAPPCIHAEVVAKSCSALCQFRVRVPSATTKVGAQCRGLERPKAAMASVSLRLPPLLKSTADRRVARGDGHRILVVPDSSALRASLNRRKAGTHSQIVQFGPGSTLNPFPQIRTAVLEEGIHDVRSAVKCVDGVLQPAVIALWWLPMPRASRQVFLACLGHCSTPSRWAAQFRQLVARLMPRGAPSVFSVSMRSPRRAGRV